MRTIVKDGIRISRLTLGTVQLGMSYGIANRQGMPDEQSSSRILDQAVGGGVVSFDTAQDYGRSEEVLGRYFVGNSDVTMVTKCTIGLDASAAVGELERYLTKKVETSLERLNVRKIPVFMLHHASDLLKFGKKLTEACITLKRSGMIDKMGVSFGADPAETTRKIWTIAKEPLFEVVQVPVNVLDHRLINSGMLFEMGQEGKIVMARSIFLQGLLLMDPSRLPERLHISSSYIHWLNSRAEGEGMSLAEFAVAFVRDLPQVHSLVIGAETPDQVESNLGFLHAPEISEHTRSEIMKRMADVPELVISPQHWQSN